MTTLNATVPGAQPGPAASLRDSTGPVQFLGLKRHDRRASNGGRVNPWEWADDLKRVRRMS